MGVNAGRASLATLAGLLCHYLAFYAFGTPLLTEAGAEWIMARTPHSIAVAILTTLGPWAKPFAMTGALAVLGLAVQISAFFLPLSLVIAIGLGALLRYDSLAGQLTFWIPSLAVIYLSRKRQFVPTGRRQALVMTSATAAVAIEAFLRNRSIAEAASPSSPIGPEPPQVNRAEFARGLVRKAVTPTPEFYGMSKNGVDPSLDPRSWRLRVTYRGKLIREWDYGTLLALPRSAGFATLRCISNTLNSDLMGTAYWSGIRLGQILDANQVPADVVEIAFLGADGHGDSMNRETAFSHDSLLALGMNGRTLNRDHGFPIRLVAPRYYGFKSIKWLSEIELRTEPYYGTWAKLGYTKEPLVHTGCHIDRVARNGGMIRAGGVAFAGIRGIRTLQVRAGNSDWVNAVIEQPLSPLTLVRWYAELKDSGSGFLEARAQDGAGNWQQATERPLFPDGVAGPTRVRL